MYAQWLDRGKREEAVNFSDSTLTIIIQVQKQSVVFAVFLHWIILLKLKKTKFHECSGR
jgi:hypothetical protein